MPDIRPYRQDDLGRVMQLWERVDPFERPDAVDEAVDLLSSDSAITIVADADGELVGTALASYSGARGWVHKLTLSGDHAQQADLAGRLLEVLEAGLAEAGARTVGAIVRHAPTREHLERGEYRPEETATYLVRRLPVARKPPRGLVELGGQLVDPQLWDELKGVEEAKEIIERRVILPLAEPGLASRHAVAPPKAIVLFGPPGTGKTTFAKGIASRLGWPFVEIEARELSGEGPEKEAKLLAHAFDAIYDLSSAVVFIDEVEDLASTRHEERKVSAGVTNELLKQIPRCREATEHLLVCATNWVGRLDPAFLRPGRFDYVLPVGPPDRDARAAIWTRYTDEITDEQVDLDALVEATELFTPADIEFAARKAAQRAFEREHFGEARNRARTDDFLAAIEQTRPTLSEETLQSFEDDTKEFARY